MDYKLLIEKWGFRLLAVFLIFYVIFLFPDTNIQSTHCVNETITNQSGITHYRYCHNVLKNCHYLISNYAVPFPPYILTHINGSDPKMC